MDASLQEMLKDIKFRLDERTHDTRVTSEEDRAARVNRQKKHSHDLVKRMKSLPKKSYGTIAPSVAEPVSRRALPRLDGEADANDHDGSADRENVTRTMVQHLTDRSFDRLLPTKKRKLINLAEVGPGPLLKRRRRKKVSKADEKKALERLRLKFEEDNKRCRELAEKAAESNEQPEQPLSPGSKVVLDCMKENGGRVFKATPHINMFNRRSDLSQENLNWITERVKTTEREAWRRHLKYLDTDRRGKSIVQAMAKSHLERIKSKRHSRSRSRRHVRS